MKNKEQIKTAQELIKSLQDYVELAKVEKKLKDEIKKEQVNEMVGDIVLAAKKMINEI